MNPNRYIDTVEMHTGGEPFRIVTTAFRESPARASSNVGPGSSRTPTSTDAR